jgi:glutamate transport system substrate-binding protein
MGVRRLGLAASLLSLSLLAAACGGDDDSTSSSPAAPAQASFPAGSTMESLQKAQKIVVGTKFDQPLFGLKNLQGKPEGFDVEIATLVAGELGIPEDKVEFVETVSANREPFLQQKKVDMVVATYTINDKRKEIVDFAGPYYVAGQDIMVKKGNPDGITDAAALGGKKVCSVAGSTPAGKIRSDYPQAQLVEFDVYSKCAEALKNGQVQAVTTDNVILLGLIDKDKESFELVGKPFTQEPYGIGLAQDRDDLRHFVNQTLTKMYTDGRWAKAWEDTAGKAAGATPTPPAVNDYA